MKSILVPTDFSDYATKAFDLAVVIATSAKAAITLLHITWQNAETDNEEGRKNLKASVQQKLDAIKQNSSNNIIINTAIMDGDIVPSILDAITTYAADLVVMGTKGATGMKKVVLGSNTANIIGKSPVPVLSIPAGYTNTGIKEVALAINHTENLQNLSPLFELAAALQAQVRLAIFTGEKDDAATYITDRRAIVGLQQKIEDQYGQIKIEVDHLSGTNFQETLQEYITANNIDLLAMITRKRGALEGLFNKSITKEMAYHATIPMLCLYKN